MDIAQRKELAQYLRDCANKLPSRMDCSQFPMTAGSWTETVRGRLEGIAAMLEIEATDGRA